MRTSRLLVVGIVAIALASCGGGAGVGPMGRAIDRSGQSAGTLDAFGSIFVNGVEWDTDGATIIDDDQPGSEANLQVGEFVVVSGTLDTTGLTGTAEAVEREPLIRGQITDVDLDTNTLVIAEHTILIDTNSVFAEPLLDLAGLAVGDMAEVDGLFTADSDILATLVKIAPPGSTTEVRGVVTSLDSSSNRFMLAGLVVDAETAAFEDFSGDIANGDFVEVAGSMFDANGALLAVRVELEASSSVAGVGEGTEFEVTGLITSFTDSTDFSVSGVRISTDATTRFEKGSALDLALNVRVEVEGRVGANNTVIAEEIEFKLESNLVIEALVEAVTPGDDTFTILGVNVMTNTTTQIIDESDANIPGFKLSDLAIGDYVKVKAVGGGDPVIANLVKRLNPENNLKITGAVTSVNDPEFTIEGALVQTDGATSFEDASDNPITAADFFLAVQNGGRVEAQGQSPAAGMLLAGSVELK